MSADCSRSFYTMSKLVEILYKRAPERPMGKGSKAAYLLLLITSLISLISAYYDPDRQLLHQVCTTAGIIGAMVIAAANEIKAEGIKSYLRKGAVRDIGVVVLWLILLVIWVKNPTVEMLED